MRRLTFRLTMPRYNHRVFSDAWDVIRWGWRPALWPHMRWHEMPRPAYCARCGAWTWCTGEVPALTTRPQFLCEECADINEAECDAAWAAFCNW